MRPLTTLELLDYTAKHQRTCSSDFCDVWVISARVDTPGLELLECVLSEEERARAGRFRFEADRARFIAGRGALRRILACYRSLAPDRLEFQTGPYGKPALVGAFASLEFNVSHSGDYVLIAVTSGTACGVDIECARTGTDHATIAAHFFSAREVEWLYHNESGFLRLWTVKEAIIKAVGGGLSIPLCDFDVTGVLERKVSSVALASRGIQQQTLWLHELPFMEGYAAAVATVEHPRLLRVLPERP
jgi:4'-phosphopantetheinyl transferase